MWGYATEGVSMPGERAYMIEASYRTGNVDILVTLKGLAPLNPRVLNDALEAKLAEWAMWDKEKAGEYSDD